MFEVVEVYMSFKKQDLNIITEEYVGISDDYGKKDEEEMEKTQQ